MHPQIPVDPSTPNADEHPDVPGGPSRPCGERDRTDYENARLCYLDYQAAFWLKPSEILLQLPFLLTLFMPPILPSSWHTLHLLYQSASLKLEHINIIPAYK